MNTSATGQPLESFSQYGEDLILWKFFGGRASGFFIEIGANHPTALSNTWFFEQRGWRGIVIEPIPDNCQKLRAARPGSQVVEAALGAPGQCGQAVFKLAAEDMLSGLESRADVRYTGEITVRVRTLDDVLAEAGNPRVDFISLDVEGTELDVLRGFDLARHRPAVLVVEDHWRKPDVHDHLCAGGYRIVRRTGVNSWYVPADAQMMPATPFGALKAHLQVGYTLMRRGLRSRFKRLISGGGRDGNPARSQ